MGHRRRPPDGAHGSSRRPVDAAAGRSGNDRDRALPRLARARARAQFAGYEELALVGRDLAGFWASIWDFFEVKAHAPYSTVLASDEMPGATSFPGARLNFAEHLVGGEEDAGQSRSSRAPRHATRSSSRSASSESRSRVRGPASCGSASAPATASSPTCRTSPRRWWRSRDASLGAIWASCAPELGTRSVVDRLVQLEPSVLLTVGGYGFRDARSTAARKWRRSRRPADPAPRRARPVRRARVADALPGTTCLPSPGRSLSCRSRSTTRCSCSSRRGRPADRRRSSTGTAASCSSTSRRTRFSWDLKPGGRLLWFSTTSWMMWNALVAALLVRSSIVMLDGDPTWPDAGWQWRVAEETRPTFMGVSPAFLMACRKAGLEPGREHDLELDPRLRHGRLAAPARGLPLRLRPARARRAADQRQRRHRRLQRDRRRLAAPPRLRGEISGRLLGVATDAFDPRESRSWTSSESS